MSVDPRTPVIIGVAQITIGREQRPAPEPLLGWEQVCKEALADAGVDPAMATQIDTVLVADVMSWRYDYPLARLAERLGATPRHMAMGKPSGTSGQTMLDEAAAAIRDGTADIALVCGGESLATMRDYRKAGSMPPWSHVHPEGPEYAFDLDEVQHPGEVAIGLTEGIGAVYGFAMRDVARRAHLGVVPDAYRSALGETLAGMTRVAATNPHAWFRQARDAAFLTEPRLDNRMVAYPYTKHMVAIIDVDIYAALIVVSQKWADAHGIAAEKRVYPWTSCYAEDPVFIGVRDKLWKSDAMEAASKAALTAAGVTMDDIRHVDLYSCFASAVNFGRDALGIAHRGGDEVTVTGGLPYAGGPASSYMITSITRMVEILRGDPGSIGLISGVGMMMSNHIYGLYSTTPPPIVLVHPDHAAVQALVDAIPQRMIEDDYVGPAVVATYTIMHDNLGNPSHGAAICDLPGGARSYVRIIDSALLAWAEREEMVGRSVAIGAGGMTGIITAIY